MRLREDRRQRHDSRGSASGGQWQFRRRHRAVVLGPAEELTLREAQRLAEQILRPINAGCWRPQSMLTLRAFYSQHYEPDILPNLKRSTQSSYRANMNQHILPALGDQRLLDFSRAMSSAL